MTFRIETERLLIRPWEISDRPTYERFVADTEMMRFIAHGRVWDAARIDAYFARQAEFLATHGCCVGAVILKQNREIIGMGGIQPLDKLGMFEFAWLIWKAYWGQGFATEMARGCQEHAFRIMHLPKVAAVIDAPNVASIRVAQKLGMRCEGSRDAHELAERYPSCEVLLYTLDSDCL
ncbi:MAG: GNAT family N-acetyltransferase [Gammaproteobacteria bacterium]